MRAENLQQVIHATPFRPFRLCLADGTRVEVIHPDFIASPPGSRTAVVFGRDDSLKIIDVGLGARGPELARQPGRLNLATDQRR